MPKTSNDRPTITPDVPPTATLARIAAVLKLHQRIVARRMAGDTAVNPHAESEYPLTDVAGLYGISANLLTNVLEGRDELIEHAKVAQILGLSDRGLDLCIIDGRCQGQYRPDVDVPGMIVRWSSNRIIDFKGRQTEFEIMDEKERLALAPKPVDQTPLRPGEERRQPFQKPGFVRA